MIFLLLASHPKPVSSSINKRDVNLIDLKMAFFAKKIYVRKLKLKSECTEKSSKIGKSWPQLKT